MASYATIPAEAEAEKPLLNRDLRVNLKTVIGGAAVASFVLGALAAAVVSGAPARTNSAALYAHSGYQPSAHVPMAFHAGKKNGESCKKDAECRSGDCHKGDGPYKNKCKDPSHPSHYDKKPNGATCKKDDECRSGDCHKGAGEYQNMGVNCGGDSFVEGDVLFTMYPKYELAY